MATGSSADGGLSADNGYKELFKVHEGKTITCYTGLGGNYQRSARVINGTVQVYLFGWQNGLNRTVSNATVRADITGVTGTHEGYEDCFAGWPL